MARLTVVAASNTGRVREVNEDCVYVDGWISQGPNVWLSTTLSLGESGTTVAVIDGMGGHAGGALASATAGLALASQSPDAEIGITLMAVSDAVSARGREIRGLADMGATIAGLTFRTGTVRIFNLGDSRVYRFVNGFLGQQTVDDLLPDPTGRRKGLIGQSLGGQTSSAVDPHALDLQLEDQMCFLVCSDGLHDFVSSEDMAACLRLPPADAVPALLVAALDAGAPDNVSVIVARVELNDITQDEDASGVADA
jgi:serine/threonine protein phosphatase PrpC